jgi:hypothetical protein
LTTIQGRYGEAEGDLALKIPRSKNFEGTTFAGNRFGGIESIVKTVENPLNKGEPRGIHLEKSGIYRKLTECDRFTLLSNGAAVFDDTHGTGKEGHDHGGIHAGSPE